ncbi:MAG: hypothetical protein IJ727_12685 [Treponema sp.]|nr:hypothetical protein [Treponema sp.]
MGCDISEQYYFAGSKDGVKKFHDFLKPFECNDDFEAFLNEKYPIDKSKLNDTSIGFYMGVDEIKSSDKLSAFSCSLCNRNSISAFVFKELLDNYFPGIYMYFEYYGDSVLSNTFNTNDKEQRFFALVLAEGVEEDEVETYIEEIYVQNAGIPEPTVEECHALCGNPALQKYEISEGYGIAEKSDFTAGNSKTEKKPEKSQEDSDSPFGNFPDDIPF